MISLSTFDMDDLMLVHVNQEEYDDIEANVETGTWLDDLMMKPFPKIMTSLPILGLDDIILPHFGDSTDPDTWCEWIGEFFFEGLAALNFTTNFCALQVSAV